MRGGMSVHGNGPRIVLGVRESPSSIRNTNALFTNRGTNRPEEPRRGPIERLATTELVSGQGVRLVWSVRPVSADREGREAWRSSQEIAGLGAQSLENPG